jgi:hypothetical protein
VRHFRAIAGDHDRVCAELLMSHVNLLSHAKRTVRQRAADIFAWVMGSRAFAQHQRTRRLVLVPL